MCSAGSLTLDCPHLVDVQVYFGAHGHADGLWVAAKDLRYFEGARERVMVYPGAPPWHSALLVAVRQRCG